MRRGEWYKNSTVKIPLNLERSVQLRYPLPVLRPRCFGSMPIAAHKRRAYQAAYHRARYADPAIAEVRRRKEKDAATRRKVEFQAWKNTLTCARCPESHVACLEFHHPDPKAKEFSIGAAGNRSLKTIIAEAKKCIVLCANCHRKEHARLRLNS